MYHHPEDGTRPEKEDIMGLFESNPWLLVPIIIVTVEGWNACKSLVRCYLQRREQHQRV